jgi:hypothetical protein
MRSCEFGRINRMMIENMDKKLGDFMLNHTNQMNEIISQNKDLYNHQSKRFPPQAVWAISVLSAIAGGVILNFATKLIGG